MSYKSCGNCLDDKRLCQRDLERTCIKKDFKLWEKIPCPLCGGTLSEIREQGGKHFRHCYSCHMEQEIKEEYGNNHHQDR